VGTDERSRGSRRSKIDINLSSCQLAADLFLQAIDDDTHEGNRPMIGPRGIWSCAIYMQEQNLLKEAKNMSRMLGIIEVGIGY